MLAGNNGFPTAFMEHIVAMKCTMSAMSLHFSLRSTSAKVNRLESSPWIDDFFDLLERDIGNNLILASGCGPKVVNADSRFMHNLSIYSRFKMGQAISNPSSRINGYIQGDSWSVQVALVVMAVRSKTMMAAHVLTSGFLDDSNFRANNLEVEDGEISDQRAKHLMQLSTEFASVKRKLWLTIIPFRGSCGRDSQRTFPTLRWSRFFF